MKSDIIFICKCETSLLKAAYEACKLGYEIVPQTKGCEEISKYYDVVPANDMCMMAEFVIEELNEHGDCYSKPQACSPSRM